MKYERIVIPDVFRYIIGNFVIGSVEQVGGMLH